MNEDDATRLITQMWPVTQVDRLIARHHFTVSATPEVIQEQAKIQLGRAISLRHIRNRIQYFDRLREIIYRHYYGDALQHVLSRFEGQGLGDAGASDIAKETFEDYFRTWDESQPVVNSLYRIVSIKTRDAMRRQKAQTDSLVST